nr:THAP domain-containing protein 11-like [Dermacentor andersoni]
MPGCCVPQCSNHSRNGWRMFHFPRDPKRRLLWLVRVKRDKWQPTNSSCVCSAHFEASSFEQNRADGWKKLKPNAVPTVFPFKELPKERRPPRERNAHVPALFSDDAAAHNSSREVRNVLPSTTQEFSPADSSSDGEINERLAATETNNANGQLTSTPRDARLQETAIVTATQPLDSEAAELRKKIADLTAANNKLRQHHNESKNTVKKLQMQVRKLQKEATNFSRNTKFLNEDQIRALSRNNNHGNSWSAQTVKQGLKIKFACGTTGYETLRKIGYPLPSSRTLARRIQGLKFLPGILHEVIDVMRSKAEGMEDVEKDCVLFLDEMEIAPGFELDRGEDVLLGGTTLPSKPEEPANHALVFMLGASAAGEGPCAPSPSSRRM